jgi:hypothetical protein
VCDTYGKNLGLSSSGTTDMVLQHVRAREPLSTAGANSLDLPPVHLVHMTSEIIFLDSS